MLFEGSKGFHFVILSVQTGQIHCGRSRVPGSSDPCNHVFKMLNSLDPPCLDDKRHHSPSPHPVISQENYGFNKQPAIQIRSAVSSGT